MMAKKKKKIQKWMPLIVLAVMILGLAGIFLLLSKSGTLIVQQPPLPPPTERVPAHQTRAKAEENQWKWDESKLGKLWVLDIGRDDCVECVAMHEITRELKNEYKDQVIFSILNLEEYPDVERQFRITSIPTIVVADGMGRELHRKEGLWPKREIQEFLAQLGIKP